MEEQGTENKIPTQMFLIWLVHYSTQSDTEIPRTC